MRYGVHCQRGSPVNGIRGLTSHGVLEGQSGGALGEPLRLAAWPTEPTATQRQTATQVRAPGSARSQAITWCAAASGSEVAAIGWAHGHQ